jgi:hypothetical protein
MVDQVRSLQKPTFTDGEHAWTLRTCQGTTYSCASIASLSHESFQSSSAWIPYLLLDCQILDFDQNLHELILFSDAIKLSVGSLVAAWAL